MSAAQARPGAVALILTDFDSESCGVGHTTGSWARSHLSSYSVIDPRASVTSLVRQAMRPTGASYLLAYPTRNGRGSPKTLLLLALLGLRGVRVNVHLHEFPRAHPIHKIYIALILLISRGTVVVSTPSEARYARRRTLPGRRIEICPAPAGSLPITALRRKGDRDGFLTVGIFGIPRANKGLERMWEWLDKVAEREPVLVELVGTGWSQALIPTGRSFSRSVKVLGHVPQDELASVFARWDLALAPFSEGATDGRNSLRTPCAGGVPAVTVMPPDETDLTFRPPTGLHDIDRLADVSSALLDSEARDDLSRWTNEFDRRARERLCALLGVCPLVE